MDVFIRSLNGLLMMAIPVALGVWLASRYRAPWGVFVAGAVTFVLSQVGHLPFNQFLLSPFALSMGWVALDGTISITGAIVYGLSAGVFEELARYLILRFWKRDVRNWGEGMMFGAGHGGIEAVLLGGLALTALIQALAARGVEDLSTLVAPDQIEMLQASLESYWALPWYAALLGAFERLLAMTLHLSLTLLVIQGLRSGKAGWLGAAIVWHAFADALVVYIAGAYGAYVAEAVLLLPTAGSLAWILYTWRQWKEPPDEEAPELALASLEKVDVQLERTELDDSRYQ